MDTYKDDVIDNLATASVDIGSDPSFARIYNVKNISYQLAPMPFETTISGDLAAAVSVNNYVKGDDVLNYPWSILHIKHDIDQHANLTNLGLVVNADVEVKFDNNNALRNTWYLKLDGKIDLKEQSQLVQTQNSELDVTSIGFIERDQQGTVNKYNYNYWSSPVGKINATSNNIDYTVSEVFKDASDPDNLQPISWTTGLNSANTSPVTLSSYWIFKFQNLTNSYANWSSVGSSGALYAGQGFTLKGSSATTATQNYTFVGKPNNGAITSYIAPSNLNLSGNPYACAIDADAFIVDNLTSLTGTIYFWEHFETNNTHTLIDYQGGYATRTLVGGTPPVSPSGVSGLGTSSRTPGKFIPVGQGFIVTGSSTGGTIKFNNAQRAFIRETNTNSNVLFRHDSSASASTSSQTLPDNSEDEYQEDTYGKIRLGFNSANNYHRQLLLGFMDNKATSAIDKGYDALHLDSQPSDMYFLKGSTKLVIMGESYFNEMLIYPLGVKNNIDGNVSFTLDGLEHFDNDQPIYIYDNQTQQYHNIKNQAFQMSLPAGTYHDRFSLRFVGNALGVNEGSLQNGIAIAYGGENNEISIKNSTVEATVTSVSLYNMLGQAIQQWNVAEYNQSNILLPVSNLSSGTYIVSLTTTEGTLSKKISF
jgi:hypothetical protein